MQRLNSYDSSIIFSFCCAVNLFGNIFRPFANQPANAVMIQ